MAYPLSTISGTSDTFSVLIARVNDLVDGINSDALRKTDPLNGNITVNGSATFASLIVSGATAANGASFAGNVVFTGTSIGVQSSALSISANVLISAANTTINSPATFANTASFASNVAVNATATIQSLIANVGLTLSNATFTEGSTHYLGNTSILTPSTLTTNQDDWHPSGIDSAAVVVINATNDRTITGIIPSAGSKYRLLYIYNASAFTISLAAESSSSSAANRFTSPYDTDYPLGSRQGAAILYDPSTTRWRVLSSYVRAIAQGFTVNGAMSVANTLTVTGNVICLSSESVAGNVSIGGCLAVVGATTLSNTLTVAGATTLSSTLTTTGLGKFLANTSVNATLTVINAVVTGDLTVSGGFSLSGDVGGINNLTASGTISGGAVSASNFFGGGGSFGAISGSSVTSPTGSFTALSATNLTVGSSISAGSISVTTITGVGNFSASGYVSGAALSSSGQVSGTIFNGSSDGGGGTVVDYTQPGAGSAGSSGAITGYMAFKLNGTTVYVPYTT